MKIALRLIALLTVASLIAAVSHGHDPEPGASSGYHAPGDVDVTVDHQLAREAVKRGDAAPLQDILAKARPLLKGDVVGTKFEQHFGVWMYEFRVVDEVGHMRYVHVDAKTGEFVPVGGHPCESC